MPPKKAKGKGPALKPDAAKLQEEARQQHIEESTALILKEAANPQKELLSDWIEEAIDIQKQEAMRGLERAVEEHASFLRCTDSLLQSLKHQYSDIEEASRAAAQTLKGAHAELHELQQKRQEDIYSYFIKKINQMRDAFISNIQDIQQKHSAFINQLKTLLQLTREEQQREAAEDDIRLSNEYIFALNKRIEVEHQLQAQSEEVIQTLKRQIETATDKHAAATQTLTLDYKRLSAQDKTLAKQVEEKNKQIFKIQNAIARWKTKVRQHKQDFEERNSRIKGEAERLRKHCKDLRNEMEAAKALEQQRLTEVSLSAKEKKDTLLEQLRLADKIHRMAALCRKYERPDDPPPDSSYVFDLTDEEMRGWSSESKKLHAALKEAAEAAGEDAGMLHNFLNKIAAVSLEAACLERSLSLLTEKTASLKESVKRQKEEEVLLIDSTGSPPVSVLSVSRLSCKETSTLKPRQTAAANTA